MTPIQINTINKRLDDMEKAIQDIRFQLGGSAVRKPKPSTQSQPQRSTADYTDVPGVVGTFDGASMVTLEGQKYEVPANYAAKSKLVYGDALKLIEEDGKQIYKHINKVPRQKAEGILTKKDGLWYVLTDRGSYKVSDVAAEFQKSEVNTQVKLLLPAENLDAPFATIDELEKPKETHEKTYESPILSQAYSSDVKQASEVYQPPVAPSSTNTSVGDDDLV